MSAVRSSIATRIALVAAGGVCLALGPGRALAASPEVASAAAPSTAKKVVLFGSSSMNDSFGHLLAADLVKAGHAVTRKGVAAAGFSRPDYRDVFEIAKQVPVDAKTELVVVYLGMNDAQAFYVRPSERAEGETARIPFKDTERWNRAYEARATSFLRGLCERGATKVAVLLPVDVVSPVMQARLERIRASQRAAAASVGCASAISTAGDTGRFKVAGGSLREPDGVHMSARGAQVIWQRIKASVLGLTAS